MYNKNVFWELLDGSIFIRDYIMAYVLSAHSIYKYNKAQNQNFVHEKCSNTLHLFRIVIFLFVYLFFFI